MQFRLNQNDVTNHINVEDPASVRDAVIALFGVPERTENYLANAIECADALSEIGDSVSNEWQRQIDRVQAAEKGGAPSTGHDLSTRREVVSGINAFTLALRSVNPEAQVRVVWVNSWYDPGKEAAAAKALGEGSSAVLLTAADVVVSALGARPRNRVGQDRRLHLRRAELVVEPTATLRVYPSVERLRRLAGPRATRPVAGSRAGEDAYVRMTATTTAQLRPAGVACTNAVIPCRSSRSGSPGTSPAWCPPGSS